MKIEVGKTYRNKMDGKKVTITKVGSLNDEMKSIEFVNGNGEPLFMRVVNFVTEYEEQVAPSKPAHYDTAIDTIAFAKANFSREQVEGFMRINAVKYIQRYEAKNGVDDVRKAVVYLNMLIEHLEEEGK